MFKAFSRLTPSLALNQLPETGPDSLAVFTDYNVKNVEVLSIRSNNQAWSALITSPLVKCGNTTVCFSLPIPVQEIAEFDNVVE